MIHFIPYYSPLGFYFATGSYDRTSRLWSTDHIQPLKILAGHYSDVEVYLSALFVFSVCMQYVHLYMRSFSVCDVSICLCVVSDVSVCEIFILTICVHIHICV